jgi:signal transduction histidine kinase
VQVSVKDSGLGIDEGDIPELFKPFSQIVSDVSRKQRGTGLGLALSKGIIEAHGGKIWVKSEGLGKGSTFIFSLPVVEAP